MGKVSKQWKEREREMRHENVKEKLSTTAHRSKIVLIGHFYRTFGN